MQKIFLICIVIMILAFPIQIYAEENSSQAQELAESYQAAGQEGISNIDNVISDLWHNIGNNPVVNAIMNKTYQAYQFIKNISGMVFAISIIIGIVIMVFARRNKGLRRNAILICFLFIPLIIFLLVFGLGYGYSYCVEGNVKDPLADSNAVYMYIRQTYAFTSVDFYYGIVSYSKALLPVSVYIGVGLYILGKYKPRLRKMGLYGFCICIPVALLLVVFGIPFLNAAFV